VPPRRRIRFPAPLPQWRGLRIEAPVSDWMELNVAAPVAANLAALGWSASHPRVREVTPITARGHSAVVIAPPTPAWAGPALAGAISHLEAAGTGRLLVVTPADAVVEWSAQVESLLAGTRLTSCTARSAGRATRLLRGTTPDIMVLSADLTLALVGRGELKTADLTAIVLAWPERWAEDAVLLPLMQDLPATAQRVILSSSGVRAGELAERYARKSPVGGPPEGTGTAGPVRTVSCSWARRVAAVPELVELLDPVSLTVWTADTRLHAPLRAALAGVAPDAVITTTPPEAPAGMIVALDLPDAATLTQLLGAGEVVLLVPTGTESWSTAVAAPRRPVLLPGVIDEAAEATRKSRAAISRVIAEEDATEAALVLAPLFERFEAPAVAAALYALWQRRPAEATPTSAPATEGTAEKLWVGIGRKDEVGANELVAFLTREIGVERGSIGRIEVRENFSLIEVPRAEAPRIAEALSGRTMRRRRLVARVDRGAPPPSGRPPRGRTPA